MTRLTPLAPLLERFFTDRLLRQRQVSPHTIASYRDTFRLFLKFTARATAHATGATQFRGGGRPVDWRVSG
jgi:hypothetical protein